MEENHSLAGTSATLNDQILIDCGAYNLILVFLNGPDNIRHLRISAPLSQYFTQKWICNGIRKQCIRRCLLNSCLRSRNAVCFARFTRSRRTRRRGSNFLLICLSGIRTAFQNRRIKIFLINIVQPSVLNAEASAKKQTIAILIIAEAGFPLHIIILSNRTAPVVNRRLTVKRNFPLSNVQCFHAVADIVLVQ